jgi:hypothetical protein
MTIIVAHHLIEGPILVSDSRATEKKTKNPSDTATKILPLIEDCIVGIVGNPVQATSILLTLRERYLKDNKVLNPDKIIESITYAANNTNPVNINDSRCKLIFCYLDRNDTQKVPIEKLRFHWEKTSKPIISGEQALPLVMHIMSGNDEPREINFNFPKSHIVELSYPNPTIKEIGLLEMDAWGSGAELAKKHLKTENYKLWSLESYKDVPWFKTMIIAASMEDLIKEGGKDYFIGGFPQVVALTPGGIFFQSYESGSPDQEKHTTMKYNNGSWEQINNKTGKIVKTTPSVFGKKKFDESEIVDFVYYL